MEAQVAYFNMKGFGVTSTQRVIPHTIPGECVTFDKKPKRRGRLVEVVRPSVRRQEPRCIHFGVCGGCQYQHVRDAHEIKEAQIRALFHDIAPEKIDPILVPPSGYGWRNKMEFTFSQDLKGQTFLGLHSLHGRGRVEDLQQCPIATDWMVRALRATREFWHASGLTAYRPSKNHGTLRTLQLRQSHSTPDCMAILHVSSNPDTAIQKSQVHAFVEAMLTTGVDPKHLSVFLTIQQSIRGQKTQFYEMHLHGPAVIQEKIHGLGFMISPQAFFQPNSAFLPHWLSLLWQRLDLKGTEIVWDLYCGTFVLGCSIASRVGHVYGVELSKEACLDARENMARNQIANVTLGEGDVFEVLDRENWPRPELVIVDPPRNGLDGKALDLLLRVGPEKIVYISCNPKTLRQNYDSHIHTQYDVESIQPLDQFPQTAHVETVIIFTRRVL